MDNTIKNHLRWKKSRSGAWSSRGYHYQHLVTTIILLRQWANIYPAAHVVPEGHDDCVIEFEDSSLHLQMKSRIKGRFSNRAINEIFAKSFEYEATDSIYQKAILERKPQELKFDNIDTLFFKQNQHIIVCENPAEEALELITKHIDVADIIAKGLIDTIYRLVADASVENAQLEYTERRKFSVTEIEKLITERLKAQDSSAIDFALSSNLLKPVDFNNPINDNNFYKGTSVHPGHIAAGLAFERPEQSNISKLLEEKSILLSGPSGAGKSALMWMVANNKKNMCRWFQVSPNAGLNDALDIIDFLSSRIPRAQSPIGIAIDDVKTDGANLWGALSSEINRMPHVYLIGSIRHENVALITSKSDTEFIEVKLSKKLAAQIWEKLKNKNLTSWEHWIEPYENSNQLMLEYIHILTQGSRLETVIQDQIDQRERECRYDELSILRTVSVVCNHGGEVDSKELVKLLQLDANQASKAFKRLSNEHLIKEKAAGVIGELHQLRTAAIKTAIHDELTFFSSDTTINCISAITKESLPHAIYSIFKGVNTNEKHELLIKFSKILEENHHDIDLWSSIFYGLGYASLNNHVDKFICLLKECGVQPAQWSFASIFLDPSIDLSFLASFESHEIHAIKNSITKYRKTDFNDLRNKCLSLIPTSIKIPVAGDFKKINHLLTCISPIEGRKHLNLDDRIGVLRVLPRFHGRFRKGFLLI